MCNLPIYPFAVVMNWDSWNKLPKDVQKVMDDLRVEQSEWTGVYMDNHVNDSIAWSKENYDIEIIELSGAETDKWNERLDPIVQKWVDDAKAKGLPAQQIIADIQAFAKKHAK
jgi:TRAP-type C4-dicarboxylate transport system substrate-binding protein